MDGNRPPLSVRRGQQPEFAQVTGVPKFLWPYLRDWIYRTVKNDENDFGAVYSLGLDLHMEIGESISSEDPAESLVQFLDHHCSGLFFGWDSGFLIFDIIDSLLGYGCGDAEILEEILHRAGHELRVSPEGDRLVERIDPVNWNSYEEAVRPKDSASRLMQDAWALAFGCDPNLLEAWNNAIKSIETLLKPVVLPDDEKATIGKMTKALRDKPEKWTCYLPDREYSFEGKKMVKTGVEVFIDTLSLIGYQPNRHGGGIVEEVDETAARGVLFLAATVLGWLREGVLVPVKMGGE